MALRPAHSAILLAAALALACGMRDADDASLRTVHIADVRIDPETSTPLVELVEDGERARTLDIAVGEFEAESIARAIDHQPIVRPNPHDLLKSVLDQIHGHVRRSVVTELRGATYYAVIEVELGGRVLSVDARPSDAIAVALRANAPVLVRDSLFRAAGIPDDAHAREIDWRTQNPRECAVGAPL
ncbi:MAG: bifunctional nuclease family protein [Myxococcota bacterium]